ncbi:MAG: MOSC domain-containing protein [Betaproteobacteria bacterium]|nr:MOSC domain-containing protein [Betaproteobacteria bacterium]
MAQVEIFVGQIRPLPDSGRPTGMYKQPLREPMQVLADGFAGDEQADRRVHGGPEKAVHLYPARHYAVLAAAFADAAPLLVPGSIGENLSSAELDEHDVRVGETWRLGQALLQVCQPRNPCWKIDERFGCRGMAAFIVEQRINGWYWRVLRPGLVDPSDTLDLVERPAGAPTLRQALDTWHAPRPDVGELRRLADTPGIAMHWRSRIEQRLDWLREHEATGGSG